MDFFFGCHFFKNFILLIAVTLMFALRKPQTMTCELSGVGINLGKSTYPYKNIRRFWIIYDPPHNTTLNFETTAYLNSTISVELANQNPFEVKEFLNGFLPEDLEKEESMTDAIARKLKF